MVITARTKDISLISAFIIISSTAGNKFNSLLPSAIGLQPPSAESGHFSSLIHSTRCVLKITKEPRERPRRLLIGPRSHPKRILSQGWLLVPQGSEPTHWTQPPGPWPPLFLLLALRSDYAKKGFLTLTVVLGRRERPCISWGLVMLSVCRMQREKMVPLIRHDAHFASSSLNITISSQFTKGYFRIYFLGSCYKSKWTCAVCFDCKFLSDS